jgi:hypothetical protein
LDKKYNNYIINWYCRVCVQEELNLKRLKWGLVKYFAIFYHFKNVKIQLPQDEKERKEKEIERKREYERDTLYILPL